jgi:retron-type reverse transcriptase
VAVSFDNLSHEWLMRMLAERIDDQAILRLLKKWLKAGVLDTDGKVLRPEGGTPQGGIISPILANVYLHYALDLWFERVFQRGCRGGAFLHRYADDFVCGFGQEEEAQRFYKELEERLRKFGLELAAEKTRVIPFSRHRRGETSFDFWVSNFVGVPIAKDKHVCSGAPRGRSFATQSNG